MTLGRAEAQERLAQSLEYRACVAPQPGAEVLGFQERAARLEEIDAAVDLVHVVATAHDVKRKLHVDAHARDPLANMYVSTDAFRSMTEVVVRLADEVCHGRILSILEGGYDLAALAESSEAHVRALLAARD